MRLVIIFLDFDALVVRRVYLTFNGNTVVEIKRNNYSRLKPLAMLMIILINFNDFDKDVKRLTCRNPTYIHTKH